MAGHVDPAPVPTWRSHLLKAVRHRNVLCLNPYELVLRDLEEAHRMQNKLRKEVETLRETNENLKREIRVGGGSSGGSGQMEYIRSLEDKVKDLEGQVRSWNRDAQVLIDLQAEHNTLKKQLSVLTEEHARYKAERDELLPCKDQLNDKIAELNLLRNELDQLRVDFDRISRERKDLSDENRRLTDACMESKLAHAEKVNELNEVERKLKEVMSQVGSGATPREEEGLNASMGADAVFHIPVSDARLCTLPTRLLRQIPGHRPDINAIAMSSSTFATGSSDNLVKLWDLKSGEEKHQLRGPNGAVLRVQFSPTGDYVVAATGDGACHVWGSSYRHMYSLVGHTTKITGVCFGDERTLLSCSADRTIRRWDLGRSGACTKTTMCWSNCTDLAAPPCGAVVVASAHYDGGLRFWDTRSVNSVQELKSAHVQTITSVCFSSCGAKVLSSSRDGCLKYWDTRMYREINQVALRDYHGMLNSSKACLSPDDRFMAIGVTTDSSGGVVQIYDTLKGKLRSSLRDGHTDQVSQVVWSQDGQYLLSAGLDGVVSYWTD